MTPSQILNEVKSDYCLNDVSDDYKFRIITDILAYKLACEMAEKEYYKTCMQKGIKS